jgi:hypothetical protein
MALAVGADKNRDEAAEKARRRLLALTAAQQAKDGSWNMNPGGRPPMHGSPAAQTAWVVLAMTDPANKEPWPESIDRAHAWLAKNEQTDDTVALALRILVDRRFHAQSAAAKARFASLLKSQNADGGWSQMPEMKSDAFATGLALYVLSGEKETAAIGRGRDFLVKTQNADGSWPMTSRPAPPPGPGPARNLSIIRYWGSAWALIGLVRTTPRE